MRVALVGIFVTSLFGNGSSASAYGYGYDCGHTYGYNYECSNTTEGVKYNRYKYYKDKFKTDGNKRIWFKVSAMRHSKDPRITRLFKEMKTIYYAHKFDKKVNFEKLKPEVKAKFIMYKKYHGYNLYRKNKNIVFN